MNKKLIIATFPIHNHPCTVTVLEEEGRIVEMQIQKTEDAGILGNIYIGKVQKIVSHIQAAFIDISPGCSCYYPMGEKQHPFFTSYKTDSILKAGDELIVQVRTEAIKLKMPTVTSDLNIAGKYLALTTEKTGIGLSAKLSPDEKEYLKSMILPHLRENCGLVVRTNARDVDKAVLLQELDYLYSQIDQIYKKGLSRSCYSLIKSANPEYIHTLRNIRSQDLESVITDTAEVYERIQNYLDDFQPEDGSKLRMYADDLLPLYKLYSMETILTQACQEKVWLNSGGFLMIQQTEAFVAIDVNTGKYQGKKKPSETYRKINLEAAKEIAIQLRLRNLSGIILIDFINMTQKEHQEELLSILQKHLKNDFVKAVVIDITSLHIVEVTRQKTRKSLIEQISMTKSKA